MNPLRWIGDLFTWDTGTAPAVLLEEPAPAPAREQIPPAEVRVAEAAGQTVDADEDGWRRLSGDDGRDLSPVTQARMQQMAYFVWERTLLGRAMIELPIAFLLAGGVRLKTEEESEQEWLDRFWHDPINKMDAKLPKKVRELSLYGEVCWPTFVNEADGFVRLGYLDPAQIAEVIYDPDNTEQAIGIVTIGDKQRQQRKMRVIVAGPESVFTERTQGIRQKFTDGECFYFKVNDLSNSRRGRSDLLAAIDWVDGYDELLFGELDRARFMRSFFYDVTLNGATPEQVRARAKEISPPKPGAVRVHNDAEEWETQNPALGAYDSTLLARLLRNHILGGLSLPEHWFGGGGDVNRATAGEMAEPYLKTLEMRQALIGLILQEVGTYVIWRRRDQLGQGKRDAPIVVTAEFPELSRKDTTAYAAALSQVVSGAMVAVREKLMSRQTALALIASIAERLGVTIDPEAELQAAEEEAAAQAEADAFSDLAPDPSGDQAPEGQDP